MLMYYAFKKLKLLMKIFLLRHLEKLALLFCISGEKSYNSVAIISRFEFTTLDISIGVKRRYSSHLCKNNNIELHNFYVPAGGDEPDISINPKFEHKISFTMK